jgi:hypothetical protein
LAIWALLSDLAFHIELCARKVQQARAIVCAKLARGPFSNAAKCDSQRTDCLKDKDMRRQVILSVLTLSLLGGCARLGASKLNPLNWFGPSEEVALTETGQKITVLPTLAPKNGYADFQDTRPLVPTLTDVAIVKSASGAIVTATGRVPSLGYFDAELVRIDTGTPSELVLDFRLRTPQTVTVIGTEAQRNITVARSISAQDLANIRTITVRSASGARVVRR